MFLNLLFAALSNITYLVLHVNSPGQFPPPLSSKKEAEYIKLSLEGNEEARRLLIEHNLRLVAHIVKKYPNSGAEQEDLISIGTIGLIKAVSTYKEGKVRLATYAACCIENEILMFFRSFKKTAQDVLISEPIDTDAEGNNLTFGDIISDGSDVVDDIDLKWKIEILKTYIISELTPREQKIISMRYGLSGGNELPQREVAARLHISRSYVSRIEKKALEKLRAKFGE